MIEDEGARVVLAWLAEFQNSGLTGQVALNFKSGRLLSAEVRHSLPIRHQSEQSPAVGIAAERFPLTK